MPVMTEQHRWVKHTVTDVSVVPDPENDNQSVIFEDPRDIEEAEEKAVYGCDRCGVPMLGNTETECDPMCHCGAQFSQHSVADNHSPVEMQ